MYEIIAMDNAGKECVIYNDKANNTDYKVENPKLVMAEDTAGSLNFKIPPTHPHYDTLDPMKTLLKVIREDECIWAGRITEMRMDLWDQKEITCEGVLGFLNDTVQEPGILKDTVAYDPKKILQLIINRHNTQIQKADGGVPNKHKTFTVGVVNVYEDPNDTLTPDDEDTNWYTDWNTSWNALNQILFERYPKGHLRCQWRKDDGETEESWHIDYISQENYSTSEQTIEFGKNLIDFTRNYTMTDLKTVCLPRGAVLEDQSEYIEGLNRRLGVTTVNNIANGETSNYNDQFIRITQAVPDSTALEDMGWIVQEVVWDEVSDKTKLKKRAKKWLREEQFDNMVIEINAVDLHYLNPSIKSADILTKIRCISKPHGMDREFPITKIEIVLDKPESSKITLGSSKQRSFTGSTVGKNRDTDKEISDIWKEIQNKPKEAPPPSWITSTWTEVFKAIHDHHSGNIDLYRDYGWRPGDSREIVLNAFDIDALTTDYNYVDVVSPASDGGYKDDVEGTDRIIANGYNVGDNNSSITLKATLLEPATKDIIYRPQTLSYEEFYKGSRLVKMYEYVDSGNEIRKKCAFVVLLERVDTDSKHGGGDIFCKFDEAGGREHRLPFNTTDRETNLEDRRLRWKSCWFRDFLGANGEIPNIYHRVPVNVYARDYSMTSPLKTGTYTIVNKTPYIRPYFNDYANPIYKTLFYNLQIPMEVSDGMTIYYNPRNFFQQMINKIADTSAYVDIATKMPVLDTSYDYIAVASHQESNDVWPVPYQNEDPKMIISKPSSWWSYYQLQQGVIGTPERWYPNDHKGGITRSVVGSTNSSNLAKNTGPAPGVSGYNYQDPTLYGYVTPIILCI